MTAILRLIASLWCRYFHGKPMHPHHGKHECRICLRTWPVPWSQPLVVQPVQAQRRAVEMDVRQLGIER